MSATEWKFVPVEPTIEMVAALGFDGDVDMTIGHGAISAEIVSVYTNMLDAAPVQPSVESLLENWTPSDQQAFARFRDEHFPGEMSSYAIQSLGLAWKDGQANASTEVPQYTGTGSDTLDCILGVGGFASFGPLDAQPAAHLTIPGALEWDGDNGTHGVVGTHSADSAHSESDYDDAKDACVEIERTGAPGDVIREMNDELVYLRTELDGYKSKWLAKCEALKLLGIHARHAEKLVKSCREKLDVDSTGKGFIEALDGFIGAVGRDDNTHGESGKAKPSCESCGGWGHIETEDSAYDCPECGPSVIELAVEAGVMNAPKPYAADDIPDFTPGSGNKAKRRIAAMEAAKQKTCIECDQHYCHGVCVERSDQDYDRDQAAKGGCDE